MRVKIEILIAIIFCGLFSFGAEKPTESAETKSEKKIEKHVEQNFPKILSFQGSPKNMNEPVHLNQVLLERGWIEANSESRLELALSAKSRIIIEPGSEVEMPVITWGEGIVLEIRLKRGKIFFACEESCHQTIWTPLSRQVFGNGEIWLEYDPTSPVVQLFVLHGEFDFNGLENEELIKVGAGKKVAFQGLKEDGEVAYDHLLHGRLVARGKLGVVTSIAKDEISAMQKELEKDKKAKIPAKAPTPPPGHICKSPWGSFNDCHWSATDKTGHCLRKRCNASGEWSDPEMVSRCSAKDHVGRCDF